MKLNLILLCLIVFAWPLYYLYQKQLGAVSFLLLAIFFFVIAMKELKKLKASMKTTDTEPVPEKIKRNNR